MAGDPTGKTTVKRLVRIDWDTVGRIIARMCADELDPDRLHNLFEIGIDEVSWRQQHRYLTLVADHLRGQIVWGTEGNGQATADRFFSDGKSRSHAVEVISLDMGPGYAKNAREHGWALRGSWTGSVKSCGPGASSRYRSRNIPKRGGKLRHLGVPTVRDRVVQAALKTVLEPIFEADFKPCSYGFRPGRRAHDAIAEIHMLATNSYEWVLEADIKACFDEISHTAALQRLRADDPPPPGPGETEIHETRRVHEHAASAIRAVRPTVAAWDDEVTQ